MEYILLLITAIVFLSSTSSANVIPIPEAENNLLTNSENINKNKNMEFIKDHTTIIDSAKEPEEMMHTAENIVFRPLFSYRQVKEKRQRLHNRQNPTRKPNNSANRRSSVVTQTPVRYVYAYPYPGYRSQENPTYYYPSYSRYYQ